MCTNCSHWNVTQTLIRSELSMSSIFFFSWTVNEGLYREKKAHTHKLTGQKSEESLKTTAKRVAIKTSVCQGSHNIHTRHFCKNSQVFFFLFFFLTWESLRHITSFSPFVVSVLDGAVAQNGGARGPTWCLPFSHFLRSRVLRFSVRSSVKQAAE